MQKLNSVEFVERQRIESRQNRLNEMKKTGAILRARRKALGVDVKTMAAAACCTEPQLARVEQGLALIGGDGIRLALAYELERLEKNAQASN